MKSWSFLPAVCLLAGCSFPTHRFPLETSSDVEIVPPDQTIEVTLTAEGRIREVEFHVPIQAVPGAIQAAADRHMSGGMVVGCEKEYVEGVLHWEVTKRIGGRESEILFDTEGNAVAFEMEIDPATAPTEVMQAVEKAIGGSVVKVERIFDQSETLTEYHVKKDDGGKRYKITLSPDGRVLAIYREARAEIEVPIR